MIFLKHVFFFFSQNSQYMRCVLPRQRISFFLLEQKAATPSPFFSTHLFYRVAARCTATFSRFSLMPTQNSPMPHETSPYEQHIVLGLVGSIGSGKTARVNHIRSAWNGRILDISSKNASRQSDASDSDGCVRIGAVELHVETIFADLVAHECYQPPSSEEQDDNSAPSLYHQLINVFGPSIVAAPATNETEDTDGEDKANSKEKKNDIHVANLPINRQALGQIVFADPTRLEQLNALVWPAVYEAVRKKIIQAIYPPKNVLDYDRTSQGHAEPDVKTTTKRRVLLIVLEAALLTEMGDMLGLCDEVLLLTCAPETAKERVLLRDPHLSTAAIEKRIKAQPTAEERRDKIRAYRRRSTVETSFPSCGSSTEENKEMMKGGREAISRESALLGHRSDTIPHALVDTTYCANLEEGLRDIDVVMKRILSDHIQ